MHFSLYLKFALVAALTGVSVAQESGGLHLGETCELSTLPLCACILKSSQVAPS